MLNIFLSGGPVMYPLLACSMISLTVIIERSIFWFTLNRRSDRQVLNSVMDLCESGDWEAVRRKTAGSKDPIVKILISGILHRRYSMVKAMEASASDEIKRMRRFMNVLDTMITVAPLLGIFGTVIGIIQSFEVLGTSGIEHPEIVTAGIAQALITTAAGLGIAILSVFPYNYFNSLIENAAIQVEKYATSLEIVYQRLIQKDPSLEEFRP
ncbi:MAG: MotA/TolQ/ExbB proton channel family protein [Desulfobacterales bacterium]